MKNKFLLLISTFILFSTLFISCYTPSPLYGTWTDNDGNKIQFMDDGTFTANISNTDESITNYTGTWTTVDNVLIFSIAGDTTYSRNTEWDLQGARLNLTWTANGSTKILVLWHTSRT